MEQKIVLLKGTIRCDLGTGRRVAEEERGVERPGRRVTANACKQWPQV